MQRALISTAAVFSVLIALTSYRFLAMDLRDAFPDMGVHIDAARWAFLAHIAAAPIALAIAVFQLMPRLRARRIGLHRWMGRTYAVAIAFGGVGALVMAPSAHGGPVAVMGFGLLAVLWLGVTAAGVLAARAGNLAQHRRWMIRSFALTFAAVTLRLELFPMIAAGMEYVDAIRILSWLAWVPNLLVAEWVLMRAARPVVA